MKKKNNRRILICGRPGSGKTTLAVLEMIDALKHGVIVYSNIDIKWFGELFVLTPLHKLINKVYNLFMLPGAGRRSKSIEKLEIQLMELREKADNCTFDIHGVPDVDLTACYFDSYYIKLKIQKLKKRQENIVKGFIKPHYYPPKNYHYVENIQEAITDLVEEAKNDPDKLFSLVFDEGFIELDHSRRVPAYITNFFNQSRKLMVDVIIASQRPVAVYPSYRALCDFIVRVEKTWFNRFHAKKYYVDDNADALPDFSKDAEGKDKGENYMSWAGKQVFPFFDTRQSIGLKRFFNI